MHDYLYLPEYLNYSEEEKRMAKQIHDDFPGYLVFTSYNPDLPFNRRRRWGIVVSETRRGARSIGVTEPLWSQAKERLQRMLNDWI